MLAVAVVEAVTQVEVTVVADIQVAVEAIASNKKKDEVFLKIKTIFKNLILFFILNL